MANCLCAHKRVHAKSFVSSNLLYILQLSLPCCTQYHMTLNHITMGLNVCNAMSMAAHPPIKDACMIPHGFYCELHTNNISSIIHRTAVDMKWFHIFTWHWHINATVCCFKQTYQSILSSVLKQSIMTCQEQSYNIDQTLNSQQTPYILWANYGLFVVFGWKIDHNRTCAHKRFILMLISWVAKQQGKQTPK